MFPRRWRPPSRPDHPERNRYRRTCSGGPSTSRAIVDDCLRLKLPALWLQLDVIDDAAAARAQAAGMTVVMDRCILVERRALAEQVRRGDARSENALAGARVCSSWRRWPRAAAARRQRRDPTPPPPPPPVGARRAPEQHELYRARSHAAPSPGSASRACIPHSPSRTRYSRSQAPGDDARWFVVEQAGRVRVFDNVANVAATSVLIDIAARVRGRRRARACSAWPSTRSSHSNGRVFLYYTRDNGAAAVGARRVHEPRRRLDARSGAASTILLTVDQPFDEPQRRTSRLRPGRDAVHGARGRRLARRSG